MNDPHAKLAKTHLSIFRPYTGNPKHEDQLTRAALIVMKFVPRAHDAWISARSAGLQIHVRPSVQIQRTWKLATAVALDRESHFADDVKHAIDSMLAAHPLLAPLPS